MNEVVTMILITALVFGILGTTIVFAYWIGEKRKKSGKKASIVLDFLGHGFKYTKLKCPHCNHIVEISSGIRFIGPHTPRKQYIKCRECSKSSWMETIEL